MHRKHARAQTHMLATEKEAVWTNLNKEREITFWGVHCILSSMLVSWSVAQKRKGQIKTSPKVVGNVFITSCVTIKQGKGMFIIAQYPFRWPAQNALHFAQKPIFSFRHQLEAYGKISATLFTARRLFTCRPTPLSWPCTHLMQLSELCDEIQLGN